MTHQRQLSRESRHTFSPSKPEKKVDPNHDTLTSEVTAIIGNTSLDVSLHAISGKHQKLAV
jgi:hypothetical protein